MITTSWVFLAVLSSVSASFCGKSGVPFSVEVLPSGAPVLGCAQPSCVAQPADDIDDSVFNTDLSGQIDGFFREGDNSHRGYLQTNKLRANCSEEFDQLACSRKNQWVGGIEYIDHPRQPLLLQCCTFEGLRFSQIVGVTPIGPGEAVTGGEVVRDGRQISFDVIANIRKVVSVEDPKIISYEVAVRRMNCLPDPPEIEIAVDDDVEMELVQVLENAYNGSAALGHTGHTHMENEVITELGMEAKIKSRRDKRKKGHIQQHLDRPGSFGAPIFNPTPETEQQQNRRTVGPYRRTIPTRKTKPELIRTEIPTTTTTTTTAPFFTFPNMYTFPTNMYTFPTIPPPTQLFLFNNPNPAASSRLLPSPISPQAFGVSQANLSPLPPSPTSQQLHHFDQLPLTFMQSPQPLQQQFQPLHDMIRTESNSIDDQGNRNMAQNVPQLYRNQRPNPIMNTQETNPQQMLLPIYHPPGFPQRQEDQNESASLLGQFFNLFTNTDMSKAARQNKDKPPDAEEKQQVAELSLPPMQQQLGALFRPPPFPALSSALQNFQAQG